MRYYWVKFSFVSLIVHSAILAVALPGFTTKMREVPPIEVVMIDERPLSFASVGSPPAKNPVPKPAGAPKPAPPKAGQPKETPVPESAPLLRDEVVFKDVPAAADSGEDVALQDSRAKSTGPSDGLVHAGPSGSGKGNGSGYSAGNGGGGGGTGIGQAEFGGLGGPRFLRRELPEYPLLARRRKKEGTVSLMITISATGKLMKVDVISTSDEIFVGPSIEAVKKSTFIPATRNGIPVTIKAILPIRFALSDS
jgi:protein TonB